VYNQQVISPFPTVEGPLYQRIAQELRDNILSGIYKPGEKLPTEEALALRFGVNRHTLRRSIALLATDGLLRVDQGRGTFVSDTEPIAPIRYPIGDRVRYSETLRAQGIEPRYEMVRAITLPASQRVAELMDLPTGTAVALVERLGLADNRPLKIASSYFPLTIFPDILERLRETPSISRLFQEAYDRDHQRRSTRVTAQTVTSDEARLLGISANSPVLVAEAVNIDQHGQVIEYGVTRFRADRTELFIVGGGEKWG
jgi:GntR family phosphonate transport system transcriptional regulator